jgi:hypothetical protein
MLVAYICAIGVALKFRRYTISTLQSSNSVLLRNCLRNSKYSVEVVTSAPEFVRSILPCILKRRGGGAEFRDCELSALRHLA